MVPNWLKGLRHLKCARRRSRNPSSLRIWDFVDAEALVAGEEDLEPLKQRMEWKGLTKNEVLDMMYWHWGDGLDDW